ncbi:FGGY-family carbohydrate kinase [Gymnodinialimonas hymeniacidonis]|uniref:xylulokinase n=1 Tax=Gymnodinialimonas hymeniacidonis TaxID=3126508 RepID=UPI0034C5EF85
MQYASSGGDVVAIDLGTGSLRAALVDPTGRIRDSESIPLQTSYPQHGWVEQAPEDWWSALCAATRSLAARHTNQTVSALCCCGHMHAPVLVDKAGELTARTAMLWNDKRSEQTAQKLNEQLTRLGGHGPFANPATSAWPGVKLAWLAKHNPRLLDRSKTLLMPKDFLNLRLTGNAAMDWTEAGSSFLMDPDTRHWSVGNAGLLGIDMSLLPSILAPWDIIGSVRTEASKRSGLPVSLPVSAGAGDYPCAILGSGAVGEGALSDITGTSYLLTAIGPRPVIDPMVMNVMTADGQWGAFAVVDAAGDALRWLHKIISSKRIGFEDLNQRAEAVSAGAEGLLFLPYLTGERLGDGAASRGAFIGLSAKHDVGHMARAVMEGVAIAMHIASQPIWASRCPTGPIVAAAGGRKSDLWLRIKASVLGQAIRPTAEPESGLLGCAALAQVGSGTFATVQQATNAYAAFGPDVVPDATLKQVYADQIGLFETAKTALLPINRSLANIQKISDTR